MLVLTRRVGEAVFIDTPGGERIKVIVLGMDGKQAKVGIDAPRTVDVVREEIDGMGKENKGDVR